MLRLRRLEIEGFGPFADRAELTFPNERGVTVVYGDNMRGKTSLMNAIRYAFLGEIQGRGDRTRGILSACNRDLVAARKFGFRIGLAVHYEGADFDLMREVTAMTTVPQSDADFTAVVALRRGGVVLGPAERTALLRAMLPRDVARFFLFDGELLDQYAELLISESDAGRVISEAIEQILGVPVLRDARDHLMVLASAASRASAKEASKHQKTQAIGNALESANDMKEFHEQERDRKAAELEDLLAKRDEIETELRHQEAYAAAVERLDRARKDRKAARAAQEVKSTELKVAMKDAWRTVLEEPVADAKAAAQEAVEEAFSSFVSSLRLHAIENGHCRTCDQDVPEDVRLRLAETLPSHATAAEVVDFAGNAALTRKSELDGFRQKDVRGEVRLIWEALRQARLDEAEAAGRIVDANKILEDQDPDELRNRKLTLTELGSKIGATRYAIAAEQKRIDEQNEAIARFARQLEAAGTPELAAFQQRERVLDRTRTVFADAVDRYKTALRSRVQESATELFVQMTTEKEDYASLAINEHYGLTIIHKDGRAEDSRSAGAEQVVALALMGALQANAPLRGPIVMDTPFGRLDPKHTANVVRALPTMAEQVVLFVQEGEIDRDTIRELLGSHLLHEYQLDKETARRTRVMEAR
ncbi:MAG: AAA family ATPase [Immundisolibacterales bacterium]|nr:AAA family ATPase [Immundisolibacterales bacterium]